MYILDKLFPVLVVLVVFFVFVYPILIAFTPLTYSRKINKALLVVATAASLIAALSSLFLLVTDSHNLTPFIIIRGLIEIPGLCMEIGIIVIYGWLAIRFRKKTACSK